MTTKIKLPATIEIDVPGQGPVFIRIAKDMANKAKTMGSVAGTKVHVTDDVAAADAGVTTDVSPATLQSTIDLNAAVVQGNYTMEAYRKTRKAVSKTSRLLTLLSNEVNDDRDLVSIAHMQSALDMIASQLSNMANNVSLGEDIETDNEYRDRVPEWVEQDDQA